MADPTAAASIPRFAEPITNLKPAALVTRTLGLRDLVLFNLVAILGVRWLATSAKAGSSALVLWVLAAAFFFVPQGLAVAELSARYPNEGGIYYWTKRRFGEFHGFVCGWCYWINNIMYYPTLLISTAVIATYVVGLGGGEVNNRWSYVLTFTLVVLWFAVVLNVVGVSTGKWLQNLGGAASYLAGGILFITAAMVALHHGPANAFTAKSLVPVVTGHHAFEAINLWATIAFAFAGLELIATMGDEIKDPRRNLPRSMYISAPLIAGLYIVGTAGVLWLVPADQINAASGALQAVASGADVLGPQWRFLAPLTAAFYTIGVVGCIGAWLTGPARVAFVIGLDRYLPNAFGKIHPRWKTPYVAIIVQAALATVFLFCALPGKGTTVEKVFLILLDLNLLIYFIPYGYLFLCLLRDRSVEPRDGRASSEEPTTSSARSIIPGGFAGRAMVALAGLSVTVIAMIVAAVPPETTAQIWVFELKVVGGAMTVIAVGLGFYWFGNRHHTRRKRRSETTTAETI